MHSVLHYAVWVFAWPLLAAIAFVRACGEPVPDWCLRLIEEAGRRKVLCVKL